MNARFFSAARLPVLLALAGAFSCNQGPTADAPRPGDNGATDSAGGGANDVAVDLGPTEDPTDDRATDLADGDGGEDPPPADVNPDLDLPPPDANPDDGADTAQDSTPDGTADIPIEDVVTDPVSDAPVCQPHEVPISSPRIVVGTGLSGYEPLEGCQRVPIILGPQLGSHIWGAFRAAGFEASDLVFNIDFTLTQDGTVVAEAHYQDSLATTPGEYEYTSVLVRQPEGALPEDIAEKKSILTVHLYREGVVDLTDSVEIIPYCCEM